MKITAFAEDHGYLLGTGLTLGSQMTAGDPAFFLLNGSNLNGSNLRPAAGDVLAGTLYPDASLHIIYQSDGTTWNEWADLGGMTNPMTTQDDLIVGGAAGALARLGKGSDGQVLTVDPTTHHLVWTTPAGGSMANPMTAIGDLLVGGAVTGGVAAPARLGIAGSNTVLHGGTTPAWSPVIPADLDVSADNTTADATTGHHGLLPKLGGGTTNYLRADGTWAAAGGGGGGSDLVQVASGAGSVVIPGLKGSPDAVPGSPSASDDEFGALSGWTTLGSLDTLNATDVPSHVHLRKTTSGVRIDGIYKAAPSVPYTVTAKLTDQLCWANYQQAGIMLAEAAPGKLIVFGGRAHTSFSYYFVWEWSTWTNNTTHVADGASFGQSDRNYQYLRFIVASSTSVTMQISKNGLSWVTAYSAINPGFTIGAFGLHLYGYSGVACESFTDYIRLITGTAGQTWNGYAWV